MKITTTLVAMLLTLTIMMSGCGSSDNEQSATEDNAGGTAQSATEGTTKDTAQSPSGSYQKIDAKAAKAMIDEGSVTIIDVRTQEEYDDGHIPDALLFPVDQITEESAGQLVPDKAATLLVYCRSGNRSKTASNLLLELGYTSVYDFGGIIDWPYDVVK